MNQSESVDKLIPALLAARKAMSPAAKSGENKFHRYNYANENDWYEAVMPALLANGLVLTFSVEAVESLPVYKTSKGGEMRHVRVSGRARVYHESGQWLEVHCCGDGANTEEKAVYIAETGMKKYGYATLFALPTNDDPERDYPATNGHHRPEVRTAAAPTTPPAKAEPSPQWRSLTEWFRTQVAECPEVWGDEESAAKKKILGEAMLVAKTFGVDTTAALMACTRDEVFAAIRGKLVPEEVGA